MTICGHIFYQVYLLNLHFSVLLVKQRSKIYFRQIVVYICLEVSGLIQICIFTYANAFCDYTQLKFFVKVTETLDWFQMVSLNIQSERIEECQGKNGVYISQFTYVTSN